MSQVEERFEGEWPNTVNEKLVADWLRHAHQIERVSSAEARKIEEFLKLEVLPDVMGRLVSRLERIKSRGYDSGIDTTTRWRDLMDGVMQIVDEGISQAAKANIAAMRDVAKYEAKWQAATLEKRIGEAVGDVVSVNLTLPDPARLRALVTERPIAGHNVGEWWDKLTVDTAGRIEREVRIGLAEGQSVPDIARRIRGDAQTLDGGVFQITNRHAQAISRNAAIHASNQARQEVYRDNPDWVAKEVWVATLDTRTCPKCGALDGKEFAVGEGPMPPAHPPGPSGGACRCSRAPVTRSINDVLREKGLKPRFKEVTNRMRASMDGLVPRSTTYGDWLKTLDSEQLDEALGASRASAFKAGDLSVERMVDQSGRILNLSELAKREGIEF